MSKHEEIVQREREGTILIGVDRIFARKFYTSTPTRTVQEMTGETLLMDRALVMSALVGGPLMLLGSAVLAAFVAGWWALLLIPTGLVVWMAYYGSSSIGGARLSLVSMLLVVAAVGLFWSGSTVRSPWGLALLYLSALWVGRFVYSGSTALLRGFVLRNPRAFQWLEASLTIRETCSEGSLLPPPRHPDSQPNLFQEPP